MSEDPSSAFDDAHLRKFYPLEPLADRPFALGCMGILAEGLAQGVDLWLAVRRLGPRPSLAGGDQFGRFLANIELGIILKILSPQMAGDLRIFAALARAATGRHPFSLSAARIRAQIDAINSLAIPEATAADDRHDITARIVRLNLGTGRDRLRMAARVLDGQLTFLATKARETATYRFGRLERPDDREASGLDELEPAYREGLSKLEALATGSIRLSRRAMDRPSETSRIYWSSVLFTRLCSSLLSLLRVLPGSTYSSVEVDHIWDFAAVANITRSIIECVLFHYYLCIEPLGADEWAARQNLMYLHDATSRLRIFYGGDESREQRAFYEGQRDELIEKLQASAYFATLSERQRAKFLKGRDAVFQSQDEILTRMGVEELGSFRTYYEFISSHVHSLPIAFYAVVNEEPGQGLGRGIENRTEKAFMVRAMAFAQWIMEFAHAHFISIHPPLAAPEA